VPFSRKPFALALAFGAAVLLGACQEDLGGGAACPALCPEQELEVRDTLLFPIVLDTNLVGYPVLGREPILLVTTRPDTVQTAAVARFDTLPTHLARGTDTAQTRIVGVDSAALRVDVADTPRLPRAPITFDVYDVDVDAPDPDTAAVRQLIRPDRLVGSRTFDDTAVTGALVIPISTSFVEQKVLARSRVRLAVAVRADSSVAVRLIATESEVGPTLAFRARAVSADTQTLTIVTDSEEEPSPATGFVVLRDYQVTVAIPPGRPDLLEVGGIPGRRTYLRFDLPSRIVDSVTVVRATLVVTQSPNRAFSTRDTVTLVPRIVLANRALDPEPGKAALVLAPELVGPPSLEIAVADSGRRRLELATLVRQWRAAGESELTRALVLHAREEGGRPGTVFLFPVESADETLRPRLEISYVPRAGFGLP
jgi:hypothetical protein